jgi:ribosome-interacting GTPase 1
VKNMPANLTPDYKAAESRYKKSRDPEERLDALREMLKLMPKHKGTDHLQADIKSRIKELTEELTGPRKGAARTGPPTVIRPEGAAQVALIGPPNSGKSALHDRLTGSHSASQPYPFATQYPQPGMFAVEDVMIQLVDLPSISASHPIPWMANALQPADAALLVVDLSVAGVVESVAAVHDLRESRRVHLSADWSAGSNGLHHPDDPFAIVLPTLVLAAKADLIPNIGEELEVFLELEGYHYPAMAVSALTGDGLDALGAWLFRNLGIIRVYTKEPGQAADLSAPFTVRTGATVIEVAELVHRDFVRSFKYARLWGRSGFDGQQVGRDHLVDDGDVIELHT